MAQGLTGPCPVNVALAITVAGAVISILAAIFTAAQAAFAKRQAVAAEQQAAAAKVQADLATAQLAQLKRAEDEEQGHQRWLDAVLAELRKPGRELVQVAPGDHLHAEWAIARGFVDPLSTSLGQAVILPAVERRMIPGSPEAKIREARKVILTTCSANPGQWSGWQQSGPYDEEWVTNLAAVEELAHEGLVEADVSGDRFSFSVMITAKGSAAARRGAF